MDQRLRAVAELLEKLLVPVVDPVHADVGTDHALLPLELLRRGQVARVIAIEKTQGPLQRAQQALKGLAAEVRQGDGLAPLATREVDSLSISGMGRRTILAILKAHPERIPERLVLQPNDDGQALRGWARQQGFLLTDERSVQGFGYHEVLALKRQQGPDPAYVGVPEDLALCFGPWLLKRRDPLLQAELEKQYTRLKKLLAGESRPRVRTQFELVTRAIDRMSTKD